MRTLARGVIPIAFVFPLFSVVWDWGVGWLFNATPLAGLLALAFALQLLYFLRIYVQAVTEPLAKPPLARRSLVGAAVAMAVLVAVPLAFRV